MNKATQVFKSFFVILIIVILQACGGGDDGSTASGTGGTQTSDLVVQKFTIRGKFVSGLSEEPEILVKVGGSEHSAQILDSDEFSVELDLVYSSDDLVSVDVIGSGLESHINLRSYVGSFAELQAHSVANEVSYRDYARLNVSEISTVTAVLLEIKNGNEKLSSYEDLLHLSQFIPTRHILKLSIISRLIIENDGYDLPETYDDLQEYLQNLTEVIEYADELSESQADLYDRTQDALINNGQLYNVSEEALFQGDVFLLEGDFPTPYLFKFNDGTGAYANWSSIVGIFDYLTPYTYTLNSGAVYIDLNSDLLAYDGYNEYCAFDEREYISSLEIRQVASLPTTELVVVKFSGYCENQDAVFEYERPMQLLTRFIGDVDFSDESEWVVPSFHYCGTGCSNRPDYHQISSKISYDRESGRVLEIISDSKELFRNGNLTITGDGFNTLNFDDGISITYYPFGRYYGAIRTIAVASYASGEVIQIWSDLIVKVDEALNFNESAFRLSTQYPAFLDTNDIGLALLFREDQTGARQILIDGEWSNNREFLWSLADNTIFLSYESCDFDGQNCYESKRREMEIVHYDGRYYYARSYITFYFPNATGELESWSYGFLAVYENLLDP